MADVLAQSAVSLGRPCRLRRCFFQVRALVVEGTPAERLVKTSNCDLPIPSAARQQQLLAVSKPVGRYKQCSDQGQRRAAFQLQLTVIPAPLLRGSNIVCVNELQPRVGTRDVHLGKWRPLKGRQGSKRGIEAGVASTWRVDVV